jgi:hypothetical protein
MGENDGWEEKCFSGRGRLGRCAIGRKGCEDEKGLRMRKRCEEEEMMGEEERMTGEERVWRGGRMAIKERMARGGRSQGERLRREGKENKIGRSVKQRKDS